MKNKYWIIGGLISLLIFLITYFNVYDYYHPTHFRIVLINSTIFLVCGALLGLLINSWKNKKFTKKFILGSLALVLGIILSIMGTYMATSCNLKYLPPIGCLLYFGILVILSLMTIIFLLWTLFSKIVTMLRH